MFVDMARASPARNLAVLLEAAEAGVNGDYEKAAARLNDVTTRTRRRRRRPGVVAAGRNAVVGSGCVVEMTRAVLRMNLIRVGIRSMRQRGRGIGPTVVPRRMIVWRRPSYANGTVSKREGDGWTAVTTEGSKSEEYEDD